MVTPPKRFLVAQTIFLGDVVLTLPLVQQLQKLFPESEIDFLVHARNANILENHPAILHIIPFDKEGKNRGLIGVLRLARELRTYAYDAAFVLPGSVKTAFLIFLAKIPRRIGTNHSSGMLLFADRCTFPREMRKPIRNKIIFFLETIWSIFGGENSFVSVFFTDMVKLDPHLHAATRYCSLLEPLGVSSSHHPSVPRLYPTSHDMKVVDELLMDSEKKIFIGVAPGSVWETKRWPAEYFAEVMKKISDSPKNVTFLLIGGTEDLEICQFIQKQVDGVKMIDCSGKLTPLQSAEALRRCRLLITNDTAPMHLAAAMGTPCVAIYGPTIPAFGFTPFGNKHVIVEQTSLWCRPCTPHGGHRCPIGTHECMKSISPESVLRKVTEFL